MKDNNHPKNWRQFSGKLFNNSTGIFSISNELKRKKKINDEFETYLSNLSFEEMIGLRLELAARATGNKYFGLKLWDSLTEIVRDAVAMYAYGALKSKFGVSGFLGIKYTKWNDIMLRYTPLNYFLDAEIEYKEIYSGKEMTPKEKKKYKNSRRYFSIEKIIKEKKEKYSKDKKTS